MNLLDFLISPAFAQAAPAAAPNPIMTFLPLIVLFVVFWFIMLRPQMKRAKEHRELLSKLQRGDEVVTSGGIAGRIEELGDNFVGVEIADGVRIKVQRGAISSVLPKGSLKSV